MLGSLGLVGLVVEVSVSYTHLAQLLFGEAAPAGRLPVSLPDHVGQLPVYYNYKDSYRGMDYYDARERPRYSFGSGLTYTTFAYRLLEAPVDAKAENVEALSLRIAVTNTGLLYPSSCV